MVSSPPWTTIRRRNGRGPPFLQRGRGGGGGGGQKKVKVKALIFTSRPFQPKTGLPGGGGVKKHFIWKGINGIQTCDFWSTV